MDARCAWVRVLPGGESGSLGARSTTVDGPGHHVGSVVVGVNLGGSVAFGISAIASYVVPTTQQVRNESLMNLGTFVGAVGFLIGAFSPLLPERTSADVPETGPAR